MDHGTVLGLFDGIEGFFSRPEGEQLLYTSQDMLRHTKSKTVVEIGSYLGKSTALLGQVALEAGGVVHAIDPHEGEITSPQGPKVQTSPTFEKFMKNIAWAGVESVVRPIRQKSYEVDWKEPIGYLFIDGLHDFANVMRDYACFGQWVEKGGGIAFHDYGTDFPGVNLLVDDLLARRVLERVAGAGSLIVTRKR